MKGPGRHHWIFLAALTALALGWPAPGGAAHGDVAVADLLARDSALAQPPAQSPLATPPPADLSAFAWEMPLNGGGATRGVVAMPTVIAGDVRLPAVVVDGLTPGQPPPAVVWALVREGFVVLALEAGGPTPPTRLEQLFLKAASHAPPMQEDPAGFWSSPALWAVREGVATGVRARLAAVDWLARQVFVDPQRLGLLALGDEHGLGLLQARRDPRFAAVVVQVAAGPPSPLAPALAHLGLKSRPRPWLVVAETPGDFTPCPAQAPRCGALALMSQRMPDIASALRQQWLLAPETALLLAPLGLGLGASPDAATTGALAGFFCQHLIPGAPCAQNPEVAQFTPSPGLNAALVSPSVTAFTGGALLHTRPVDPMPPFAPPGPLALPGGGALTVETLSPPANAALQTVVVLLTGEQAVAQAWADQLSPAAPLVLWPRLDYAPAPPLPHQRDLAHCCVVSLSQHLARRARQVGWLLHTLHATHPQARLVVAGEDAGATAGLLAVLGGAPAHGLLALSPAGAWARLAKKNQALPGDLGAITPAKKSLLARWLGPLDPATHRWPAAAPPLLLVGGMRNLTIPPDVTQAVAKALGVKPVWLPTGHRPPAHLLAPLWQKLLQGKR